MRRATLFDTALSDRGERIAGFPVRRQVARAADVSAPGEDFPSRSSPGAVAAGCDLASKPDVMAHAVFLSDHALVLLRAIAAYEQVDDAVAVTLALAGHAERIGAGPLARAVLDEIERGRAPFDTPERKRADGGAGRVMPCPAGTRAGGDLFSVPEFRRVGENRFRGGAP